MGYESVEELMDLGRTTCAGGGKCGGRGGCREVRNGWKCSGKGKVKAPPKQREPQGGLDSLFPPGFDYRAVAAKHVVTVRPMGKGDLFYPRPGYYDPDTKEVKINAAMDRAKVAKDLERRRSIRIFPEHGAAWVLLHEIAHHERRRFAPARNGFLRPLSLGDRMEFDLEERAVDELAHELYRQWRRSRPNGLDPYALP